MQNKVVQGKLIWLKQTLTSVNKINYGFVNKKIIKRKKRKKTKIHLFYYVWEFATSFSYLKIWIRAFLNIYIAVWISEFCDVFVYLRRLFFFFIFKTIYNMFEPTIYTTWLIALHYYQDKEYGMYKFMSINSYQIDSFTHEYKFFFKNMECILMLILYPKDRNE